MPRSVLITGITGFAGSHLAERLVTSGVDVHGLAFVDPPYANLAAVADRVRIHRGDINDRDAVGAALREANAEAVVHLAGQAVPALAAQDPVGAMRINVLGTATLLHALGDHPHARLVVASSADVYGSDARPPIDENAPVEPANVYAATKVASEALVREFAADRRAAVTILRPVNQIGPRQHPGLAASAFAKQIAEAEASAGTAVVRHGSLDARRDFLDVRDMAEAYALASDLEHEGAAVFNVGTGRPVAIKELLDVLIDLARVPIHAELDPARVRATGTAVLSLDATRFRERTGWLPRTPLRTSLADTLEYWRARIVHGVTA